MWMSDYVYPQKSYKALQFLTEADCRKAWPPVQCLTSAYIRAVQPGSLLLTLLTFYSDIPEIDNRLILFQKKTSLSYRFSSERVTQICEMDNGKPGKVRF